MPRPKKGVGVKETKTTTKKTTKTTVKKARKVKDVAKEKLSPEEVLNRKYVEYIETVKTSKVQSDIDFAFNIIFNDLRPRIQRMVNRFTIPGLDSDDVMQEALKALRFKAIKDYDKTRGSMPGTAPFDRFALLCIRRHLSTEFKSSLQNNRKKVLNQSVSLDQDNKGAEEGLSLINIVSSGDGDVVEEILQREYYHNLMARLVKNLSRFEFDVLKLYGQRYSYEEIAEKINNGRVKIKVNVKGVDNALSRIKNKAKTIIIQYEEEQKD